jgi:FAD/FMN-containing dehydrogenase
MPILVDRFGEGQKVFYRELQSLFTGYDGYYCLRHLDAVPTCLVTPDSAQDGSNALKIIIQHSCKFAVKCGATQCCPGGASFNDGVVFDLRYLNQLGILEDKATAYVWPGNRWGAVYSFLDPMNLTVFGGRE